MDKGHKPCPVDKHSSIRPLTTNLQFAGHGAILFYGIENPRNNRLASYAKAKITNYVPTAIGGGDVWCSILISIKNKA